MKHKLLFLFVVIVCFANLMTSMHQKNGQETGPNRKSEVATNPTTEDHPLVSYTDDRSGYWEKVEDNMKNKAQRKRTLQTHIDKVATLVNDIVDHYLPTDEAEIKNHHIYSEHFASLNSDVFHVGVLPKKFYDIKRWSALKMKNPTIAEQNKLFRVREFLLHIIYTLSEADSKGQLAMDKRNLLVLGEAFTKAELLAAYVRIGVSYREMYDIKYKLKYSKIKWDWNNLKHKNIIKCLVRLSGYRKKIAKETKRVVEDHKPPEYVPMEQTIEVLMSRKKYKALNQLGNALYIALSNLPSEENENFQKHLPTIDIEILFGFLTEMVQRSEHGFLQLKPIQEYQPHVMTAESKIAELLNYVYFGKMKRNNGAMVELKHSEMSRRILLLYIHLLFKRLYRYVKNYIDTEGHHVIDLGYLGRHFLPHLFHLASMSVEFVELNKKILGGYMPLGRQYVNLTAVKKKDNQTAINMHSTVDDLCAENIVPTVEQLKEAEKKRKAAIEAYKGSLKGAKTEIQKMMQKYGITDASMNYMYRLVFGYVSPERIVKAFDTIFPVPEEEYSKHGITEKHEGNVKRPKSLEEVPISANPYRHWKYHNYGLERLRLHVKGGEVEKEMYYLVALYTETRLAYALYFAKGLDHADPYGFFGSWDVYVAGLSSHAYKHHRAGRSSPFEEEDEKIILEEDTERTVEVIDIEEDEEGRPKLSDAIHISAARIRYFERKYEEHKGNHHKMKTTNLAAKEHRDYYDVLTMLTAIGLKYDDMLNQIHFDKIDVELLEKVAFSWRVTKRENHSLNTLVYDLEFQPQRVTWGSQNYHNPIAHGDGTRTFLYELYKKVPGVHSEGDGKELEVKKPLTVKKSDLCLLGIEVMVPIFHVKYTNNRNKFVTDSLKSDVTNMNTMLVDNVADDIRDLALLYPAYMLQSDIKKPANGFLREILTEIDVEENANAGEDGHEKIYPSSVLKIPHLPTLEKHSTEVKAEGKK